MTSLKNMLPDKRRTTVLVSLILLLAIFLVPYFFIFIPANADNLKRQAFLKLNRAAQNMIAKSNDTRNYYVNNKLGVDTLNQVQLKNAECSSRATDRISFLDSIYFNFSGSQGWSILFTQDSFQIDHKNYTQVHSLPLEPFISPCISSGKEVFSSFLLIHYCQRIGQDSSGKIIYQDFREGMEQDINLDSLIPRHQGMRSPDIIDLSLEGTDYKLFTYPFQLGRHRLILCGLLKTDRYNAQLHVIPVGTSYTLVICLFLFLLSLPFLKIFMMNERDRIYASNLVTGIVFLFAIASFITIISSQLILLSQGRSQVIANLDSLSVKIEDSLSSELRKAQDELIYFDDRLYKYIHNPETDLKDSTDSISFIITVDSSYKNPVFRKKGRILSGHIPLYHNSDHCSWISDSGRESVRIKYISKKTAETLKRKAYDSILVDISGRPYYQDMFRGFKYKREKDSTLRLAPVQSWASGEFRVNVCRYSNAKDSLMLQVMETRLYSLVNTVLPAGYGFCLMDDVGNVLIHSDSLKSLRENFLDETGRLPWILGSIKGRQRNISENVAFYGTSNTLRIQPLKQHPLFLAVFYNNQYQEPANLRILSFSVFFCLITYGLLFFLFRILYPRDPKNCLYSPMDYYRRIIPRRENLTLYFNGSLFLLIYILAFSVTAVGSPYISNDFDYTMLVFGLLTPFNLLYALWLLQNKSGHSTFRNSFELTGPALATGFFIYLLSYYSGLQLELSSFLAVEVFFGILLTWIVLKKGNQWLLIRTRIRSSGKKIFGWEKKNAEEKKLFSYSFFITLFIFAVAVLPALEYSWFAYNHELRQSVKKEQLTIADGIQKREKNIRSFLRNNQPDFTGNDNDFEKIQYENGIYPVYGDKILHSKDSNFSKRKEGDHDSSSEAFYLTIANTINFFSKDPAGLPPLYDSSVNDNLWHWDLTKDSSEFDYAKPKWKIPPDLNNPNSPEIGFKILSRIPGGFKINNRLQLIFLGMIIILTLAIFRITKSIVRQVYLTKIVADSGSGLEDRFGNDEDGIWDKCFTVYKADPAIQNTWPSVAGLIKSLKGEHAEFANCEKDLVTRESEIISRSEYLRPVFECVWKSIDDREKYLLYCLANDGLINHKNESLIYTLLHKQLLVIYDERIRLISYSFREFIISRNNTPDEEALLAKMQSEASWNYMRTIVLVLIMSVFVFLFLTQQEVSAKIIALVTSLSALLPFILKFGSGPATDAKK